MRKKIYNTIKKSLDDFDFKYNVDDDGVFCMGVHGENTNMNVVVLADEVKELMMINVKYPQRAIDRRMAELLKWINHFNYWSVLGAFMVDDRDGEIIFRITLSLDDGAVNSSIISACLSTAMAVADDSYPRIIKVLFQDDMEGSRPDNDNPELQVKHSQLCS